jgi:hypothetical protein
MTTSKKLAADVVVGDHLWNGSVGLAVYKVERVTLPDEGNGLPERDTVFITFGSARPGVRLFWPPDSEVEVISDEADGNQ